MKVAATRLPGVLLIEPEVFGDARGFFMETFSAARYAEAGIRATVRAGQRLAVARGVLRGLHFQHPHAQAKLVTVLEGEVFDVAVDVRAARRRSASGAASVCRRRTSASFMCRQVRARLRGHVAGSFVWYKCTDYYHPASERVVRGTTGASP